VPTVIKSIGTVGRDYSTWVSHEADLDNGAIYASGDVAQGEFYNDSVFDEVVTINGGGTVGLAGIVYTVPVGQRHDGTAGTGARIVRTGGGVVVTYGIADTTVEWLEIDQNQVALAAASVINAAIAGTTGLALKNTILHDAARGTNIAAIDRGTVAAGFKIYNNIIYDISETGTSTGFAMGIRDNGTGTKTIYNNTIHNVFNNGGSGVCYGLGVVDDADHIYKNNLVGGTGGTTTGTIADYSIASPSNATANRNESSDATAPGTTNFRSVTMSNEFVSTVDGSEDYHLKSGATAIDNGEDLVAEANVDIDHRDRDALGDVWDIGADEFVAAGGVVFLADRRRNSVLIRR